MNFQEPGSEGLQTAFFISFGLFFRKSEVTPKLYLTIEKYRTLELVIRIEFKWPSGYLLITKSLINLFRRKNQYNNDGAGTLGIGFETREVAWP